MGRHSAAVHLVLAHLEQVGFVGVPRLIAVDAEGQTETLSSLEGDVADYPLPPAFTADKAMRSAARLLRGLHDALASFAIPAGADWWLPAIEPAEIVVHGDFAPYNCVVQDGTVTGVFDFDTAHPAHRLWDVGYAAYRWVPLVAPTNADGFGTIESQIRRLPEFCEAYGTSDLGAVIDNARLRLLALVDNMRQLAADGHAAFQQHLRDQHDVLYLRDVDHLEANRALLIGERPLTSPAADTHALGYRRVDDDRNVGVLVTTMEATSRWDAIRRLREWERTNLELAAGERLIDVGCGLGEAALALTIDLGADGEVVGIDASTAMLEVARDRATAAPCPMRFTVGDTLALDETSLSFDVARCERTLQWLTDPRAAVDELARVLRPGGRMSLIDTDWSTLRLDVGDDTIAAMVCDAMQTERRRASNIGSRLGELVLAAGFNEVLESSATQVWTTWDPDASPAPYGCFSMRSLAEDLVSAGRLDTTDTDRFVSTIHDAARNGRFSMSLTMYAVIARRRLPI